MWVGKEYHTTKSCVVKNSAQFCDGFLQTGIVRYSSASATPIIALSRPTSQKRCTTCVSLQPPR